MKYLLDEELVSEVDQRQKYIYDVFKLYTLVTYNNTNFIKFSSIPSSELDILMIIGHDVTVENFLRYNNNEIKENTIIIISCNASKFKKYLRNKEIYISLNDDEITTKRDGKDYNFDFDVTESEINLYNSKGSLVERLSKSFKKVE